MTTEAEIDERPWEALSELLDAGDGSGAEAFLEALSWEEQRRAVSRLSAAKRIQLLARMTPEGSAALIEHLPEVQAVEVLADVDAGHAADILEELPGEVGASLLREMDAEEANAILASLDDREEAEHFRELRDYPYGTAGSLMSESFAAFPETARVSEILGELSENAEAYSDMDVQYVYVVSDAGLLRGVLRLRDLVLRAKSLPASEIMIADPVSVRVTEDLDRLVAVFDDHRWLGLPVVDEEGRLQGVLSQKAVQEATSERQTDNYLYASGIVGGEELRSMKMRQRCVRRLAWLGPNIVLNLIAASVIAMYEETLQAVIALAVFLPIVSDMSGCSGNQAVAVSIRELTLGLIRPHEFWRVVWKEGLLGIINGSVLGLVLGTLAGIWKANLWLGLVVGGALALNTILSVTLGGLIPLALKRLKVDPALASSPILTTCTDMCGFFLVLNLASLSLSNLV